MDYGGTTIGFNVRLERVGSRNVYGAIYNNSYDTVFGGFLDAKYNNTISLSLFFIFGPLIVQTPTDRSKNQVKDMFWSMGITSQGPSSCCSASKED